MEKTLSSKTFYKGKILEMRVDRVSLSSGGSSIREYVLHPGAVSVLPFLKDGRVVMVRQFRYPVGESLLEIPAGRLEPGEDPRETARRELIEEIGFQVGELRHISTFYTTPGYTNEVMHLFFAYELEKIQAKPESDEILEIETLTLKGALKMIREGEIKDGKTIAALALAWAWG